MSSFGWPTSTHYMLVVLLVYSIRCGLILEFLVIHLLSHPDHRRPSFCCDIRSSILNCYLQATGVLLLELGAGSNEAQKV